MAAFRSFFHFLGRYKGYTAINIIGFSVALGIALLILVYAYQEHSVDKFQKDADRIYVEFVGDADGFHPRDALPVAYWLKERFSDIEAICPVLAEIGRASRSMPVSYGGEVHPAWVGFTERNFFTIFSFPLRRGNAASVLDDPYSAVISASYARKVFGQENPVGKSLKMSDSTTVVIAGVMEDIKNSVLPPMDVLLRVERATEFNPSISKQASGNAGASVTFLKMLPGHDMNTHREEVLAFFKERYWLYARGLATDVRYVPLRDVYFEESDSAVLQQGDRSFVNLLLWAGLLVLFFSVFNYINLTVAQSGFRAKEVATRRLLGASRRSVGFHLVMEAVLLTMLSYGLAVLLAAALRPLASNLLQAEVDLSVLYSMKAVLLSVLLIAVVGLLSGLLPSVLVSAVRPVDVVKGTFRRCSKMVFSKVFIVLQNAVTIGMLAAVFVMVLQLRHLLHAPLGYNTVNILNINSIHYDARQSALVMDRLASMPCVKRAGKSMGTPFDGGNNLTGLYEGRNLSMQRLFFDTTAFNMLGLRIVRDNHVASGGGLWLSESALRAMGLEDDAESFDFAGQRVPVAGVVGDFKMGNILSPETYFMRQIFPPEVFTGYSWSILAEVQGDPVQAFRNIGAAVSEATGMPFEARFIDQEVQDSFEKEVRLSKIAGVFAGVALLISLMGLVAMSTYFIQQRRQEVAVRKVFGTKERVVVRHLMRPYLLYVGIGFVLAAPVAWGLIERWLSSYSYRISMNMGYLLLVGLFCLSVSFLAVYFQSRHAARMNPSLNLKAE